MNRLNKISVQLKIDPKTEPENILFIFPKASTTRGHPVLLNSWQRDKITPVHGIAKTDNKAH